MGRVEAGHGVSMLSVSVACSPRAGVVEEVTLQLVDGATVRDALVTSGLLLRHPGLDTETLAVGVWGALAQPGDRLRDHDRVEIYRPLQVDPKEARRLRQQGQRSKRKT